MLMRLYDMLEKSPMGAATVHLLPQLAPQLSQALVGGGMLGIAPSDEALRNAIKNIPLGDLVELLERIPPEERKRILEGGESE